MKSIFEEHAYKEILNRIDNLEAISPAYWGKMTVSQMLCHCKGPIEILLERKPAVGKPNWFFKLFFKKSFYNNKPWRKNLPTAKPFIITGERNFEDEKNELILLIEDLYDEKDREQWPPHPMLGEFTAEQYGKSMYKHLDHHLRQFGV